MLFIELFRNFGIVELFGVRSFLRCLKHKRNYREYPTVDRYQYLLTDINICHIAPVTKKMKHEYNFDSS